MNWANSYTQDEIDKIGNTLVFLSDNMKPMSKTKLLKLVYLIQEYSISKFGIPFFDIKFDLWHLGPVNPDLYTELTTNLFLFEGFITYEKDSSGFNKDIRAVRRFDDGEFSDNEIDLLNEVVDKHKHDTGGSLIDFTHQEGSTWFNTAKENGLLESFAKRLSKTTSIEIDLSKLIQDDEYKYSAFLNHKQFLKASRSLKY